MNACNQVVLVGRLTKDVEIKMTAVGNQVWSFNLALNKRGKEGRETNFISCKTYSQFIIGFADKYIAKGDLVVAVGELRVDHYKNKDGKQTSSTYVLIESLEKIGSGKAKSTEEVESSGEVGFNVAPRENDNDASDDDLPF